MRTPMAKVVPNVPVLTGILDKSDRFSTDIVDQARWLDERYHLGALAFTRSGKHSASMRHILDDVDVEARNVFSDWMMDTTRKVIGIIYNARGIEERWSMAHVRAVEKEIRRKVLEEVYATAVSFYAETGDLMSMDMLVEVVEVDVPALLEDVEPKR